MFLPTNFKYVLISSTVDGTQHIDIIHTKKVHIIIFDYKINVQMKCFGIKLLLFDSLPKLIRTKSAQIWTVMGMGIKVLTTLSTVV